MTQRIAFITGGSRGIGAGIVRSLANAGVHVIFTYSSSEGKAKELVTALEQEGKKVTAVKMDLANAAEIKSVIDKVGSEYGTIDILVNNAGVFKDKVFADVLPEDIDWMMDINFKGTVLTALHSQSYLSNGGAVINIGSVVADTSIGKGNTLYAASKSALQGFTKGLARDLGERGITVNLVQPGAVDTEMNPANGPGADFQLGRMAIPVYGQPADIAALVTFLSSAAAKYITGSIISIDGGFTA